MDWYTITHFSKPNKTKVGTFQQNFQDPYVEVFNIRQFT